MKITVYIFITWSVHVLCSIACFTVRLFLQGSRRQEVLGIVFRAIIVISIIICFYLYGTYKLLLIWFLSCYWLAILKFYGFDFELSKWSSMTLGLVLPLVLT